MADITYRTMQAADIPAALALWRTIPGLALDAADEPAALAAFLARNPGLSDIALADGAIIATLLCGEDGRRATFYHLAVAADWRGQGIARQLLARAEDRLRARGILNALGNAYWPKQGWRQQSELNYYSKSMI